MPRRHGLTYTGAWRSWVTIFARCESPSDSNYPLYGARGISVCERWRVFENFLADMGERPDGMSLDRINSDGNYEPGNCRWATIKQQNRNRRNNVLLTFDGHTRCLAEWAELMKIRHDTLRSRLEAGWSVADAINTPTLKRGYRHA
jgi:hypothetical protein